MRHFIEHVPSDAIQLDSITETVLLSQLCGAYFTEHVISVQQMYVTPPDTDIYSIPRVLAPMPQKVGTRVSAIFSVQMNVNVP